MNDPINDGGPAFPVKDEGRWLDPQTCTRWEPYNGMSLRDYFAGQALQGILSNPCLLELHEDYKECAKACGLFADAMLAARERKGES
jgi:hypothetical protein